MLFQKRRYGFEILVQKPDYSVLAIEKNCNICGEKKTIVRYKQNCEEKSNTATFFF